MSHQSDFIRQLDEERKATLKNAVEALLKGFKPEDIVNALAVALDQRAEQARRAMDTHSYHQLMAQADDLFGHEGRIEEAEDNYEPPERDYYAEGYESAFDRRIREYRERER